MLSFLNRNKFFNENQFGFTQNKSTEDALLHLCSTVYEALDKKKMCAGLFVDITKAFDMVNINILLRKLNNIGFRGPILSWFKTYLSNRVQQVKIGDKLSMQKSINIGVPQGSVLGPILFLIYINSLLSQNFHSKVVAFADDLAMVFSGNSDDDLANKIKFDLDLLGKWFLGHKLIISQKTKLMFFSLVKKENPSTNFSFHSPYCSKFILNRSNNDTQSFNSQNSSSCCHNCFTIEKVDCFRYLGVIVDKYLKWTNHCDNLKRYFRSTLRVLYNLRKYCPDKVLKSFYYGLFDSKVQYGLTVWGGTYYNDKISPLLILQKRAIRLIMNKSRRAHTIELFRNLKLLPIRHLFYFKVLKIFFQRSGHFNSRINQRYSLRVNSSSNVNVPFCRTTAYQNSFSVVSCQLFNKLPSTIKLLNNFNHFKKEVKNWLLQFDHTEIKTLLRSLY
jgi:hypothetical protein